MNTRRDELVARHRCLRKHNNIARHSPGTCSFSFCRSSWRHAMTLSPTQRTSGEHVISLILCRTFGNAGKVPQVVPCRWMRHSRCSLCPMFICHNLIPNVCVQSSRLFWASDFTSRLTFDIFDAPAGVTQEEGHSSVFFSSAVRLQLDSFLNSENG